MIKEENERLKKEFEGVRSQSVHQPIQMLVQGSTIREEVGRLLFQEENTKPGGYALVQTPEARGGINQEWVWSLKGQALQSTRFDRDALAEERRYGANVT